MVNGAMWLLKSNGLKTGSFLGLEKVDSEHTTKTKFKTLRKPFLLFSFHVSDFFILGEINLRPETGALGAQVVKGNVYFDNQPVCDDEWGHKEAKVVCRFKFLRSWKDMIQLFLSQLIINIP